MENKNDKDSAVTSNSLTCTKECLLTGNCSTKPFEETKVWASIKSNINALRILQLDDGSIRDKVNQEKAKPIIEKLCSEIKYTKNWLLYQTEYLNEVVSDLKKWERSGFLKPDFSQALRKFTPEKHRNDGLFYFAIFPMFTLNGSKETKFDTLVFEIIWPKWLDKINNEQIHNSKFVSAKLIDFSDGFNSECATLFPETISVAGKSENDFGVIFANREANRCVKFAKVAYEIWNVKHTINTSKLINSESLMQECYALWDLLHDKKHFEGKLPFHLFMVKQLNPYWRYGLEELRVDVTSYVKARELQKEGIEDAENVCYAVVWDRVLRFAVIDGRDKNLEAVAGQVIFGALHKYEGIEIDDGELKFDWQKIDNAMQILYKEINVLYKNGQNHNKSEHWLESYDFISSYVKPNRASIWHITNRVNHFTKSAKEWIEATLPDEFPLNMWFVAYQKKLKFLGLL